MQKPKIKGLLGSDYDDNSAVENDEWKTKILIFIRGVFRKVF